MRSIRLLLTEDIGVILASVEQAREWQEFITERSGCDVSFFGTVLALIEVKPWKIQDPKVSPWRAVAAAI